MKKIDLRKEIEEEEVIEFEECLSLDNWITSNMLSNDFDNASLLPLGSTTHNYYLAQDDNCEQVHLFRCKK